MPDAAEDQNEYVEEFIDRDISHLSEDRQNQLYKFRLSPEQKEHLQKLFQGFKGTKNYHNYTKDVKASEMTANRNMMELDASEFMYINTNDLTVSNCEDENALEFVHFFLKGQSFLYN